MPYMTSILTTTILDFHTGGDRTKGCIDIRLTNYGRSKGAYKHPVIGSWQLCISNEDSNYITLSIISIRQHFV